MTPKILTQEIADKLIANGILQEDRTTSKCQEIKVPLYFSVDYQCTISMSNYNVICEMIDTTATIKGFPNALMDRGSIYCGKVWLEIGEEYTSDLIDSLLGLEDYPLICEENHSDLEWTIIECDSKSLLNTYIDSDMIADKLGKYNTLDRNDFHNWLHGTWAQYIDCPAEHIEYADFDIDFKEELDTDLVFQDFLIDYEKSQLALQGLEQTPLAIALREFHN